MGKIRYQRFILIGIASLLSLHVAFADTRKTDTRNERPDSKTTTSTVPSASPISVLTNPTTGSSIGIPDAPLKASPKQAPAVFFPDTTDYAPYSYIRFIKGKDTPELTDEEFYDLAGKVIFPINKYYLPRKDSLIMQLEREVIPLINRDSLELACMMIRGAASPEGPYRFNKFLGEHRAQALIEFLKQKIDVPIDADAFDLDIDIEDYRTLCIMMHRVSDKDYAFVKAVVDMYLPKGKIEQLKSELKQARQGRLWRRLYREYFPRLRAARVIFFFRAPRTHVKDVLPELSLVPMPAIEPVLSDSIVLPAPTLETPTERISLRRPRREVVSVKSNLLFDFAYVPGYDRWCPIPNVAIEYYPKHGHFTYGFSLDFPWWQHYNEYKFFQIRNYQFETRYYLRSGDINSNPPGEGAAFRGLYLQGYAHTGLFGICFSENRGWEGEGLGAGVGVGYVMPLTRTGHWKLEFGAQAGFFTAKYDPYQYGNPLSGEYDGKYYYKWKLSRELFKRRQYRFNWFGPTRVGVSLSYDILYRRIAKKGVSFRSWEEVEP